MHDLTVIFLTANEVPEGWRQFHLMHLRKAIGDFPLITVSRQPMAGMGLNILDTEPKSYVNIYRCALLGAKAATTPYVAVAESDTLYCADHFRFYRPPADAVAYNMHKANLYTWDPIYSLKRRKTNAALIAPRALLVEALEERFRKYPTLADYKGWSYKFVGEVGRNVYERNLGLIERKAEEVYSNTAIIQVSHPAGTEYSMQQARTPGKPLRLLKRHGAIRFYDMPYWGKATDIAAEYK